MEGVYIVVRFLKLLTFQKEDVSYFVEWLFLKVIDDLVDGLEGEEGGREGRMEGGKDHNQQGCMATERE